MFTGKGGVGKTTLAVATALYLSRQGPTLLVSTDPAGSLREIFALTGGPAEEEVRPGLWVVELTRERVLRLWREKFAGDIYAVLSAFFPVEEDIIDYIQGAPGIETEFMLDYLLTHLQSKRYRFLVWDTAPTASILHLLQVQYLFYTHLTQAQKIYLSLRGLFQKADPLALIHKWRKLTEEIIAMLKEKTAAWVVANPERLPVQEALFLAQALADFGLEVKGFILNKVLPQDLCTTCDFLEEKRKYQKRWRDHLLAQSPYPVKIIPEIVGDLYREETLWQLAQMIQDSRGTYGRKASV